ncbi:TPA: glycosyltransferase [Yersinia enterocolitica]|nr:glycosyltransferase [Yersinia enterocolitica]HEN3569035.1 glycosyltransferase [Yersinia enterocolitica]HEN3573653.1 glycosyltransferase [Yersinia enterocolitica]HEN3648619.1 glycosyltransferase [Yersinia enterocolitica]HEN3660087.1 glycosyltransferase [Yersinia enterocolitica]
MTRTAVILPAYNEEQTISATIEDFYNELPDAAIWVVNNRSTDETQEKAKKTFMRLGCKGGVINENRPGKGNAVRRAFLNIDADIYILADADLTYPAAQVHKLLVPIINDEADMVVGDRHSEGHYQAENKRALHGFGNRLVKSLVNKLFKAKLVDIMSGYRVFNRAFVKSYPILVEGFEIETDMTLHALDKRFRIIEIPINYRDRPEGSLSKLNTFRDGARVLSTIGNILRYYRPLVFFGSTALIFAVIGIIAGIPVIDEWIRERFISHIPLAILATGLEIFAIVFAAIGLILDSITHQDKLNFERDHLSR